jgi:hypothetical protein
VTIQDLCDRFGVSPRTIHCWRTRHGFPPPTGGRRHARYGRVHIEWIVAWQALHHHFVSGQQAVAHCREEGITLPQYVAERERAVRDFGIGVA